MITAAWSGMQSDAKYAKCLKGEGQEMRKYWTKCGKKFEKSAKAATTGYTIDLDNKDCADCPFQIEVTAGYPPAHKRWECRAGSQEPNHTSTWNGSLEDKNNIRVQSLDNNLLAAIIEHCETDPYLYASYIKDLPDCRRSLSISCNPNKAGVAAKAALIDKFRLRRDSRTGT